MNGRAYLNFFSFRPVVGLSAVDRRRLGAALLLSCLIHGAVAFLPDPGAPSVLSGAGPLSTWEAPRGSTLEVTLAAQSPEVRKEKSARAPRNASLPAPAPDRAPDKSSAKPGSAPGGIDLLPIPAHYFHTSDQLTKRPRPVSQPVFDLPRIAPDFKPGTVILKVWIDALGNVLAVEVEKSEVPRPLSIAAAAAFRGLPFQPGEIRSRRVASLMRIEVTYVDGGNRIDVRAAPR